MLPLFNKADRLMLQSGTILQSYGPGQQKSYPVNIRAEDTNDPNKKTLWHDVIHCLNDHSNEIFRSKSTVEVYLGSEFIRYLVLPAQAGISKLSERRAYAGAAFEEIYGTLASDWQIAMLDVPLTKPTLATAVNLELIAQIKEIAVKTKANVRLVTPAFSEVILANYSKSASQSGYLISFEANRLLIAEYLSGEISQIANLRKEDDGRHQMQSYLKRASLETGFKQIWWHASGTELPSFDQQDGWIAQRIPSMWSSSSSSNKPTIRRAA